MTLTWSRVLPVGLATTLLCAPFANVQAGAVLSPTNTKVTDAGHLEWVAEPDLARQGNSLYAVWRESRRTGSIVEADVYLSASIDGGLTWGQNRWVSLPDFIGFTNRPAISVAPSGRI